MKLNLISAFVLLAAAADITAANTADLAKFVYPANKPEKVEAPVWLPGDQAIISLGSDSKTVVATNPKTGVVAETIFDCANTRELTIDDIEGFIISPDGKQLLVYRNREAVYRRSFTAEWYLYDRHSRILRPLSDNFKRQRSPIWSPDSRMVAFVTDDNNIRLRKTDYQTEVAVTTDGAVNSIINGVPDWTYEEEFSVTCSMAWAPDALTLVYLKYNETDVPTYRLTVYEGACDPKTEYALYPGEFAYKYPVAGVQNSKVSLHSYDIETRKTKEITLPGSPEYIPRLEYAPIEGNRLMVTTLNRDQNRLEIVDVNPRATTSRSLLVEQKSTGWIDPVTYDYLTFLPQGIILPSDRSGWTVLYEYGYSGALVGPITPAGQYDVTAYYGYDPTAKCHYFQSTSTGARNRVVERVDAKGRSKILGREHGTTDMSLSPSAAYAMLTYSSVDTAPVYSLVTPSNGKTIRSLGDNSELQSRFASMPKREFFTIPAAGDAPELFGYMIRPQGIASGQKAPVIMFQYSGPGSQEVRDKWSVDWENYFATQGYMIICVDGRGTGFRGREYRESVYKRLGHFETIDQIRAARYAATIDGADPDRIGIFGWSYGGYETLMCATADGTPFKAACAVAPVTDWKLYDTVYAERYMLTPQQNPEGYEESSVLLRAERLAPRTLVMYGTADDNVHPANTIDFVGRLISLGKWCDVLMFPNMNHSINYCNGRAMVYSRMLDHFNEHLR